MSNIFSSYQIKKVMFKNRIVMAPMVRFGFPCSDGIMGDVLIREYLEYCDQEIGLLISQSLSISASDDPMAPFCRNIRWSRSVFKATYSISAAACRSLS